VAAITFVVAARLENVALLGASCRGIGREHLDSDRDAERLELAVVETCTNIVQHGHPGQPDHTFRVTLTIELDALRVMVYDKGAAFDSTARDMPSLDGSIEDLPTGGFGMGIVEACVDRVEYERSGEANLITLVIRRAPHSHAT